MNEALTVDWVKRAWGTLNFGRRMLVWDAYRCHLMPSVKKVVNKDTNTDLSIIPGGLTSLVQPADVSWNKPFKEAYKARYNQWMATGEKSYTPAGNIRAPSKHLHSPCLLLFLLLVLLVLARVYELSVTAQVHSLIACCTLDLLLLNLLVWSS